MKRNKLLLIIVLSLLFPTTVSACGTSSDSLHQADPKEGKIPPIFAQLKNYRKVDSKKYLQEYMESGDLYKGYFITYKTSKIFAKCNLGHTDSDILLVDCVGNFPDIGNKVIKSKNVVYIPDGRAKLEDIRGYSSDIGNDFSKYVDGKEVNPKVLKFGTYIRVVADRYPMENESDANTLSTVTCVSSVKQLSCINSFKHGFSIDADGTHIF